MALELTKDNHLYVGGELIDRSVCEKAYTAHSETRPLMCIGKDDVLGPDETMRILQGLAKIGQGDLGEDYSGLTCWEANALINHLVGGWSDSVVT